MNVEKKVIALATDNNYVKYMYVAITSLMHYNNNIKLYIIIIEKLTEENEYLIEKLKEDYNTLEIITVSMKDVFDGLSYPAHVSKTTFARLYIPKVVKEDRCLMLDIDIIINDSLDDLFDLDITNYYLAGRRHLGHFLMVATEEEYRKYGMSDFSSYINIGVMLMNLDLMRRDGIDKELLLELESDCIPEADQGIYNKVCCNKIKFIPATYNWSPIMMDYPDCYGEDEIQKAIVKPAIIHYVDNKPWYFLNKQYANKWWEFAKKTELYSDFCLELVDFSLHPKFYNVYSMDFVEQFMGYLLSRGTIIIYGAGKNGKVLLNMLQRYGRHPISFAVSNSENIETKYIEEIPVSHIEDLIRYKDNATVIVSVADLNARKSIKENLITNGFEYCCVPDNYLAVYLKEMRKC